MNKQTGCDYLFFSLIMIILVIVSEHLPRYGISAFIIYYLSIFEQPFSGSEDMHISVTIIKINAFLQVLGKKWKVEMDYKSQISIITTVVHLTSNTNTDPIQQSPELSPRIWLDPSTENKPVICLKLAQEEDTLNEKFRKYRYVIPYGRLFSRV